MKFISVVGARPQFIKLAAVSAVLRQYHEEMIVHTGQHYDSLMSDRFFQELAMPKPEYHLASGSGTHGGQTARMLEGIEQILLHERADCVMVYGDTNSTLAGALAAAKMQIPIAHVEAGLRSYNREMPEEINRVLTDHLSERLFCPTPSAAENLQREGIVQGVEVVGDVMYDLLLKVRPRLQSYAEGLLRDLKLRESAYCVLTVHRACNTDNVESMQAIARAINQLDMPVVFPVHPRTRAALERYNVAWGKHVQLMEPQGYFAMLALQSAAHTVLTDSGGIQKEAYFLQVPCVTLRKETEWGETLEEGWNVIVGTDWQKIVEATHRPRPQRAQKTPFGAGDAALRIAQSWSYQ